jgi:enoyl-[acyl-carrier protein] reductase I
MAVRERWGSLDALVRSIGFVLRGDLHGHVIDCAHVGFEQMMRASRCSFIEMARLAAPLMNAGSAMMTISCYGSGKAVANTP